MGLPLASSVYALVEPHFKAAVPSPVVINYVHVHIQAQDLMQQFQKVIFYHLSYRYSSAHHNQTMPIQVSYRRFLLLRSTWMVAVVVWDLDIKVERRINDVINKQALFIIYSLFTVFEILNFYRREHE